jgi:hypothetical protein
MPADRPGTLLADSTTQDGLSATTVMEPQSSQSARDSWLRGGSGRGRRVLDRSDRTRPLGSSAVGRRTRSTSPLRDRLRQTAPTPFDTYALTATATGPRHALGVTRNVTRNRGDQGKTPRLRDDQPLTEPQVEGLVGVVRHPSHAAWVSEADWPVLAAAMRATSMAPSSPSMADVSWERAWSVRRRVRLRIRRRSRSQSRC